MIIARLQGPQLKGVCKTKIEASTLLLFIYLGVLLFDFVWKEPHSGWQGGGIGGLVRK
jgi:hypothetical protein